MDTKENSSHEEHERDFLGTSGYQFEDNHPLSKVTISNKHKGLKCMPLRINSGTQQTTRLQRDAINQNELQLMAWVQEPASYIIGQNFCIASCKNKNKLQCIAN